VKHRESVRVLASYELRSGRRLIFQRVDDLDLEASALNIISENAAGRCTTLRLPENALGVLRLALQAFDGETKPVAP
jgi:hypothetical protein